MWRSRVRGSSTRRYGKRRAAGVTIITPPRSGRRRVLVQLALDHRSLNRADDLIDDATVLEEQERRNRSHVQARARLDVRIDVQLCHFHFARVLGPELR